MANKTAREILRGKCISDEAMEHALKELRFLLPTDKYKKTHSSYDEGFDDGWNDCLEEVMEVLK